MGFFDNDEDYKNNGTNSGVVNHDVEVEDSGQLINENNTYNMTIDFPTNSMIMLFAVLVAIIVIVALIVKFCKK